jgi:REP element-mobilizing transposase RayT
MDKVRTPLLKDNFYHIFNRGNNGEKIFYIEENYSYFLNKFNEYLTRYVELYGYCLLPNHFHLLLRVIKEETNLSGFKNLTGLKKPKTISRAFSDYFNSYTKSINKQQNRSGNFLNKLFKRKLIDSNEYLMINVVYIHRNPLHHRISNSFQTYKWSSYGEIVNNRKRFINNNFALELFGGLKNFTDIHRQADLDFKEISFD